MRTLASIKESNCKYDVYHKIQCPYCHEELIINHKELEPLEEDMVEKEFEDELMSIDDNGKIVKTRTEKVKRKVAKDYNTARYHIKCCSCGHEFNELQKDVYKKRCDEYGENNFVINFGETMTKRARDFAEKHKDCSQEKLGRKFYTALGQQFTYTITPGGLGDCISVKCNICGESEDITDEENW